MTSPRFPLIIKQHSAKAIKIDYLPTRRQETNSEGSPTLDRTLPITRRCSTNIYRAIKAMSFQDESENYMKGESRTFSIGNQHFYIETTLQCIRFKIFCFFSLSVFLEMNIMTKLIFEKIHSELAWNLSKMPIRHTAHWVQKQFLVMRTHVLSCFIDRIVESLASSAERTRFVWAGFFDWARNSS